MKPKSTASKERASANTKSSDSTLWKRKYAKIKERCDQLAQEVARLEAERTQYKKALFAATRQEFDFNKEELLALVGKGQSLKELLAELQSEYAS